MCRIMEEEMGVAMAAFLGLGGSSSSSGRALAAAAGIARGG